MQERIGRYVLQGKIGSGSTGTVYLALEPDLERRVAIKQLAAELASYPEFLPRFRDEARTMARLNHPNCVKVFDFFEEQGNSYLVAEYVDGASLREVLDQAKKLTPRQALGVLKGALLGLVHAHSLGLVHRDIKPENVLCDREGTSKLADFGLTTRNTEQQDASQGSPLYMSPEQVKGGAVDQRSDIYSCGAMLFELLTGRPPFVADSPLAVMHMHATEPAPDPRKVNRRLPAAVAQLVMSAMAKDPRDRPQGAEAFLVLLEEAANATYGAGWETGASIAGLTAAAISAGAAAAAASTSATGTAVAGTVAASTAAGEAAATGGGVAAGGAVPASSGTARRGGVRPLIRRVGPARVAVVAVVAIVILSAGTFAAIRLIPLSSSSSKTPAPSSPTSGVARALPAPCTLLTPDIAASVIGPDGSLSPSGAGICLYNSPMIPLTGELNQRGYVSSTGYAYLQVSQATDPKIQTPPPPPPGSSVESISGLGDKAMFVTTPGREPYLYVVKGNVLLIIQAGRRYVGPTAGIPPAEKEDEAKIAVAILARL